MNSTLAELLQASLLGTTDALDQIERFRPISNLQLEHLQASQAPLECVAAFVGQPGHHLANGRQALSLPCPLLCLLEGNDAVESSVEQLRVERLEKIVVRPSLECRNDSFDIGIRGDNDESRVRRLLFQLR